MLYNQAVCPGMGDSHHIHHSPLLRWAAAVQYRNNEFEGVCTEGLPGNQSCSSRMAVVKIRSLFLAANAVSEWWCTFVVRRVVCVKLVASVGVGRSSSSHTARRRAVTTGHVRR